MGHVFPPTSPRPTSSRGEIKIYEYLKKHLPADWYAWHSLGMKDQKRLRDYEADFVVADPQRGFVVLEVKSGLIALKNGLWYQNQHEMKKSPLDQAKSFAYFLSKMLNQDLRQRQCSDFGPNSFSAMAVFPDQSGGVGTLPHDHLDRVITFDLLPNLVSVIDEILGKVLLGPSSGKHWIETIKEYWGMQWTSKLSLLANVEDLPIRLTNGQLEILAGLEENSSLLVEGGPGTGKTFLAMEACRRLAVENKKALYLCFTDPLQKWVKQELNGVGHSLTVRKLAAELLGTKSMAADDWKTVIDRAYSSWENNSIKMNSDAYAAIQGADAIILDEAQDFNESEWVFLQAITKGKRWWAFGDPAQTFLPDSKIEKSFFSAKFRLSENHRCPKDLIDAVNYFQNRGRSEDLLAFPFSSSKSEVPHARWLEAHTDEESSKLVAWEIDQFRSNNISLNQIAVCSVRGRKEARNIVNRSKISNYSFVQADHESARESLVVDTYARLKGLERPAIIVTDIHLLKPNEDKAEVARRLYLAASRAQVCLRIVGPKPVEAQKQVA